MTQVFDASVSVVIPAYNAERFLADAVNSVLGQTTGRMEIVVVDDASTDGTRAIAAGFADQGVICIPRPARCGAGAARNAGVTVARGEFLAFLDADDLWTPARTALLGAALLAQNAPAIALGWAEQFICPTVTPERRANLRTPPPSQPAYLAGGILIRRSDFLAVGPFDERLTLGEFIDWFGRARRAGLAEIVIPEIVLRRRIHGDNMTVRHRASAGDYLEVIRRELARKRSSDTHS